ncbi:hypothetical protein HZA33_00400 [Candidatus Pacearchaeota archaeon]|nr:hypothetical protein [Candidatus Pacearchaeota archaeon]
MAFQCKKCSYRFESKQKLPSKCPFCGTFGSVIIEKTAEDVIKDIDRMLKDGELT